MIGALLGIIYAGILGGCLLVTRRRAGVVRVVAAAAAVLWAVRGFWLLSSLDLDRYGRTGFLLFGMMTGAALSRLLISGAFHGLRIVPVAGSDTWIRGTHWQPAASSSRSTLPSPRWTHGSVQLISELSSPRAS